MTEETKKKISESLKGKPKSEETKSKMSETAKKRVRKNDVYYPYGLPVYSEISDRYVNPHVKVWEDFMQTPVPEDCCIHHFNGDKLDNRIENLACMTKSDHQVFHHTGKHCSEETKKKISETKRKQKEKDDDTERKRVDDEVG